MVQVAVQVEAVGPGQTRHHHHRNGPVQYELHGNSGRPHSPQAACRATCLYVCEREGVREQRLLIDLFFRLFS